MMHQQLPVVVVAVAEAMPKTKQKQEKKKKHEKKSKDYRRRAGREDRRMRQTCWYKGPRFVCVCVSLSMCVVVDKRK